MFFLVLARLFLVYNQLCEKKKMQNSSLVDFWAIEYTKYFVACFPIMLSSSFYLWNRLARCHFSLSIPPISNPNHSQSSHNFASPFATSQLQCSTPSTYEHIFGQNFLWNQSVKIDFSSSISR